VDDFHFSDQNIEILVEKQLFLTLLKNWDFIFLISAYACFFQVQKHLLISLFDLSLLRGTCFSPCPTTLEALSYEDATG
jgi:hypothetical protein